MIEAAFEKYDKSKEGFLSKDKLVIFFRDFLKKKGGRSSYQADKMAHAFMEMIDMDCNGKLSRQEIYEIFEE